MGGILQAHCEAQGLHVHLLSAQSFLPFEVSSYPAPLTIGADRLANVAAAQRLAPHLPCVAIDAGTAITFDVLGPAAQVGGLPQFLGGVIAPGLSSLCSCLHDKTALLPVVQPNPTARPLAQRTQEALQAGAHFGIHGLGSGILAAWW